ncbi:AraC family transcriptional regulator [Paenibacillus tyrfis]|uniref:response regulator n=1 Tax=Paenibacillus tyrfis TaxID=1501230 RepID=UPI00249308CB|nr:response regulator [Paenibacillus tyrfis]GLI06920.1 AraC family transcriptional regulator [Paenibacillus tyrfis]
MNLFIVEDEIRLRNSLMHHIPWEDHGIEVIGTAESGLEALELFERKKPDIVLLDIEMPQMDGITLARKLQELDPLVKLIILSGHDNFEFAQAAMDAGVMKYLLKPAGDEEILKAVLEAAEQLRQELERISNQAMLQEKWRQHLPQLRSSFFRRWAEGAYSLREAVQYGKDVQLDLKPDLQLAVAVLDMDPLPEAETRFGPKDRQLLLFSLHSIVSELLQRSGHSSFTDPEGRTVILFDAGPDEEPNGVLLHAHTTVTRLLGKVKECLKVTASAGISGATGGPGKLHKLYAQAGKALLCRKMYGRDIAIPYREEPEGTSALTLQPTLEKGLEIALETGDPGKAEELASALWAEGMGRAGSVDDVHEHVLYFVSLLTRTIQRQGWRVKEATGDDYVFFHNPLLMTTKEQIQAWLSRTVRHIAAYVQNQRRCISHDTVRTILDIVEKELDSELTLHTVADRLYVNSSYLSRLFKQETGKPFSTYVLERKMEAAKAALLKGAKVYDAAMLTGYRDVSYFTKVFRKYWGVTPGEMKP